MAEPLNATFFAFRKRERGGVLLSATLAYCAITLIVGGVFAWLNWQAVLDYVNWSITMSQADVDPNNPFAAMMPPQSVMSLGAWYLLLLFAIYLLLAAYEAACLRWMIHGEVKGFLGLALDADTLRVYSVYWTWFILLIVMYLVCVIVGVGMVAGILVGAQSGGAEANPAFVLVPIALVFAVLCLWLYLGVRLAPAAATSIAMRRFAFFDAWAVTKGRFWPLLGSFALLFVMYFVGIMLLSFGATMATGVSMMSHMQGETAPTSPEEIWAMFASPSVWIPVAVLYAVMFVAAFVFYVAMFGINARAALAALEEGRIKPAAG